MEGEGQKIWTFGEYWLAVFGMKSIKEVLAAATEYPLELTLATGQKFLVHHPDYTLVHPDTGNLHLFGPEGTRPHHVIIDPTHIVKVTPKGRAVPF